MFQVVGEGGWRFQVERLTTALVALPADTNLGYVRTAHRNETSHTGLPTVVPLPAGIGEHFIRYDKHLLDRFMPDAHGVQVVRTAHLDNAHDLSAWHLTDLDQGRHLVQAADLQPWYGQTQPDPDVLAQARADFAGALLTEDIIKQNPPPS